MEAVCKIADQITHLDHLARDAGGRLYVYDSGVYRPTGEEFVNKRVKQALAFRDKSNEWTSYKAREVVEYIRADAPRLLERPPLDTLNVANGLLDLGTPQEERVA